MHWHVGTRSILHSRGATYSHAIDQKNMVCRYTVLQHQSFSACASHFINPVRTPHDCYNSLSWFLSAPPECTVCLPRGLKSMSEGFSEVADACARHGWKWDFGMMLYRENVIHAIQCKFFTLCVEFPWAVDALWKVLNIRPFPWYWAEKNSKFMV